MTGRAPMENGMKMNMLRIGIGAMLAAVGAWAGQAEEPAAPQWRVQFEKPGKYQTTYSPLPVSIQTAAGRLVFAPEELTRIEFPQYPHGMLETVHGDRWFGEVRSRNLERMVLHPVLKTRWNKIRLMEFLNAETKPGAFLSRDREVYFQDGSRVRLTLDEVPIRLQTPVGRTEIPISLARSLRIVPGEEGPEGVVELVPGGVAMRGRLTGRPLKGRDAGGRSVAVPWEVVASFHPADGKLPGAASLTFEHDVSRRIPDGTEIRGTTPVSVWHLKGREGLRVLSTARIRSVRRNADQTLSVQTTVGEWLTGSISPARIPVTLEGKTEELSLADGSEWTWPNDPEDMPDNACSWRLVSGDIWVAEWIPETEPSAPASMSVPRVNSETARTNQELLPVRKEGKWPVSRFEVIPWDGGPPVSIPASGVEAVQALPPHRMPPALPPSGPGAAWSDEVRLPGGTFRMGRAQGRGMEDEVPPVELHLEAFWMANTPVTVAQFGAFADAARYSTDAERTPGLPTWRAPGFVQRPDEPVVCVSWRDAVHYANWLSSRAGLSPCYEIRSRGRDIHFHPGRSGYRLPLEAEWEYAARSGGREGLYPWGEEAREKIVAGLANFRPSVSGVHSWPWTSPVKTFPPTPAGLYDMAGNVWEWCQDIYHADAYGRLAHGESMTRLLNIQSAADLHRVMRGGSYYNPIEMMRCAARGFGMERMSVPRVGFRLARNAEASGP